MTRLEQVLIAINAALLALLAIAASAVLIRDQIIQTTFVEQVADLDERVDRLEAVHTEPPRPHEH